MTVWANYINFLVGTQSLHFRHIFKRKEVCLCLQKREGFLPLELQSLLLKGWVPSRGKWNGTLDHARECLFWAMHDANLFTSNFVVRLLFFFLGWSAICSLGKSLPHTPDGTSNFILSWVLRFPWGINLCTKNRPRNSNRQGDRKSQFHPWFCPRPGSLSATLWAHFLCCRTVVIILDNTSMIHDNTSSQALGIKYEMPCT